MNKDKKINLILYGSITIVVGLTVLFYFMNFNNKVSTENADWGTFGDYFGGVLNPLIGIANIIVFVYLTRTIAKLDESNSTKAIETQKALFELELKHKAFTEVVAMLNKVPIIIYHENDIEKVIKNNNQLMSDFSNFVFHSDYLLPSLNEVMGNEMFDIISNISQTLIKSASKGVKHMNEVDIDDFFNHDEYLKQKDVFLKKLLEDLK